MPDRQDAAVLKDFSARFTADTPLGALARVGAVPVTETGGEPSVPVTDLPRPSQAPRRIHWRRLTLVVAVGAALVSPVVLSGGAGAGVDGADVSVGQGAVGAPAVGIGPSGRLAEEAGALGAVSPLGFASVEGLDLVLPAVDVVRIGYHEASFPNALALSPVGDNVDNQNRTKFAPGEPTDGPDYLVLSSRGRPNPATSAVDIVMPEGTAVASVVSGRVSVVEPYLLYGRHPDTKIEIVPDGRPDLRVVLIHVDGVQVQPGDRVEAGRTVLASTANRFPFSSHIDRYADGEADPHVHIEVKVPEPTEA